MDTTPDCELVEAREWWRRVGRMAARDATLRRHDCAPPEECCVDEEVTDVAAEAAVDAAAPVIISVTAQAVVGMRTGLMRLWAVRSWLTCIGLVVSGVPLGAAIITAAAWVSWYVVLAVAAFIQAGVLVASVLNLRRSKRLYEAEIAKITGTARECDSQRTSESTPH